MKILEKDAWLLPIIWWTISAISRALDQIIILDRVYQSFLPKWIFKWDFGISTVDAFHVYQGITLITFGIGGYYFYRLLEYQSPKYKLTAWIIAVYLYYQVFNLFFHVLFLKPEYWQLPFFRFLQVIF
jgi:hypothetical protein